MNRLNGWQRAWLVLTALWQVPVLGLFALAVSEGSLSVYAPPKMQAWDLSCPLASSNDLSDPDLKRMFAKLFKDAPSTAKIEFWVPMGVDGSKTFPSCGDVSVVVNPTTKEERLAVFATLDRYYPTWHKGHDMASALDAVTKEKIEQSKRNRRNGLLLTAGAALIPPAALYALGAAIAWIRRGFQK